MSPTPNPTHSPPLALVTGASSGIGRELVRQLVREHGHRVLATARRIDRLRDLAAEFPPGCVEFYPGDLTDAAFRASLWQRAEGFPGGCSLLINNAGIGHYDLLAEIPTQAARDMIELNLLALIDLTRLALGSMIPRRSGQIIEVASVLAFFGLPRSAVYVATKHAVLGLVRSIQYETRGTGVRVWAAYPGRTHTEFAAVASGKGPGRLLHRHAEPAERVARGILRGLDHSRTVRFPTLGAWATARAATWLSLPFNLFMTA